MGKVEAENKEVRTDYCISCDEIKEIYPNEFNMTICERCYKRHVLCDRSIK